MNIPPDIHARVVALTTALIDAEQADDPSASDAVYAQLRSYCDSLAAAGRDHPFLWETLADFTGDDHIAIDFYLRALPLATAANADDYAASICLALAERHANLDALDAARNYALRADAHAQATDDAPLRRDISQFLLDHSPAADQH
jgi:hypothetical protein